MTHEPSLWSFILDAGTVVKIVMVLLLLASVFAWTVILQRLSLFKKFFREAKTFDQRFWSGQDMNNLYQKLDDDNYGLADQFRSGFGEFKRLYEQRQPAATIIESTQRAMYISQSRTASYLEQHLSSLATIGSTSPYVGLFGTVWGIMTSFTALGGVQQATIAMVAPGISEALIATAMGLFAAIPAVIAYNRFANQMTRLENQYDLFQQEFINLLQRQMSQTPSTSLESEHA